MCIMCGCATCNANESMPGLGQSAAQTDGGSEFELWTVQFSGSTRDYFMKWGHDELGRSSDEITWSMSLLGLDFDTSEYIQGQFEQAVRTAFDAWAEVANLNFREISGDADIDIVTEDENGVEALGGDTVGLASLTSIVLGNDLANDVAEITEATIYMDLEPTWSPFGGGPLNPSDAGGDLSFFGVVLHEIGHALGLEHVNNTAQIMNPSISRNSLGDGDVAGMQVLYGVRNYGTENADTISISSAIEGVLILARGGNDIVSATQGDDQIFGGLGNDQISGNGGNDLIVDTFGNNTLNGNANNDVIVGGTGNMNADGGSGADILLGGVGDDTLRGGSGNDTLRGDPGGFFYGEDTLVAGDGTDFLEGGGGADTFVFDNNDGTNFIARLNIDTDNPANTVAVDADFDSGIDQIRLNGFGYASAAEVFDHFMTVDSNAVFSDQGTTIHFVGLQISDLSENDFLI